MTPAEIAAACENAGEGMQRELRKLDAAIAVVMRAGLPGGCDWAHRFPKWEPCFSEAGRVNVCGNINGNGDYIAGHFSAPHFTTSLDAALMLVPEGLAWHISSACPRDACATIESGDDRVQDFKGHASTPALALLSAIMRAVS